MPDRSPLIVVVVRQGEPSQINDQRDSFTRFNTSIYHQVTKYAVMLDDLARLDVVEKQFLAQSAPHGPVWIECPIDIQGNLFDPELYEGFIPTACLRTVQRKTSIENIAREIRNSKKACIWPGRVRAADSVNEFNKLIQNLIFSLTSRMGMDIIDDNNPLFDGSSRHLRDRPGNF